MNGFKHKTRIQIRFKDVDKMGHVNNANHITYFELARMAYFAEVVEGSIDWVRQGIILAHTEIDYKSPILLEDEVWVHSRVSRLGRSSFEVEYVITRTAGGISSWRQSGNRCRFVSTIQKIKRSLFRRSGAIR